jgi:hypothetical protein
MIFFIGIERNSVAFENPNTINRQTQISAEIPMTLVLFLPRRVY